MRLGTRCALVVAVLFPAVAQAQVTTMRVAARVLEPVGVSMARGSSPTAPTSSLQLITRPGAPIAVSLSRDLIASGFSVTLTTPSTPAVPRVASRHRVLPGDQRRVVVISHL